jgi:hypothetical protein
MIVIERRCGCTNVSGRAPSPSRRTVGAKLRLLHDATDETTERIDLTDERIHGSTLFNPGSCPQGRLGSAEDG